MRRGVDRVRQARIAQVFRNPRHGFRLHGECAAEIVALQVHHRVVPAAGRQQRQAEARAVVRRRVAVLRPFQLRLVRRHVDGLHVAVGIAGNQPHDASERVVRRGRPKGNPQRARLRIGEVALQAREGGHAHRRAVGQGAGKAHDAVLRHRHGHHAVSARLAGQGALGRERERIVALERLHRLREHRAVGVVAGQVADVHALGRHARRVAEPQPHLGVADDIAAGVADNRGILKRPARHDDVHGVGVGQAVIRHGRGEIHDERIPFGVVFREAARGGERQAAAKVVDLRADASVRRRGKSQEQVPERGQRTRRTVFRKDAAKGTERDARLGHMELELRRRGEVRPHRSLDEGAVRARLGRNAGDLHAAGREPRRQRAADAAGNVARVARDGKVGLEVDALDELDRRTCGNHGAQGVRPAHKRRRRARTGHREIPDVRRRNPGQRGEVRIEVVRIRALNRPVEARRLADPQFRDDVGDVPGDDGRGNRRREAERLLCRLVGRGGLGHAELHAVADALLVAALRRRPRERLAVGGHHRPGERRGHRHRRKRHPLERLAVVHVRERRVRAAVGAVHLEQHRLPPGRHRQHHRPGMVRAVLHGAGADKVDHVRRAAAVLHLRIDLQEARAFHDEADARRTAGRQFAGAERPVAVPRADRGRDAHARRRRKRQEVAGFLRGEARHRHDGGRRRHRGNQAVAVVAISRAPVVGRHGHHPEVDGLRHRRSRVEGLKRDLLDALLAIRPFHDGIGQALVVRPGLCGSGIGVERQGDSAVRPARAFQAQLERPVAGSHHEGLVQKRHGAGILLDRRRDRHRRPVGTRDHGGILVVRHGVFRKRRHRDLERPVLDPRVVEARDEPHANRLVGAVAVFPPHDALLGRREVVLARQGRARNRDVPHGDGPLGRASLQDEVHVRIPLRRGDGLRRKGDRADIRGLVPQRIAAVDFRTLGGRMAHLHHDVARVEQPLLDLRHRLKPLHGNERAVLVGKELHHGVASRDRSGRERLGRVFEPEAVVRAFLGQEEEDVGCIVRPERALHRRLRGRRRKNAEPALEDVGQRRRIVLRIQGVDVAPDDFNRLSCGRRDNLAGRGRIASHGLEVDAGKAVRDDKGRGAIDELDGARAHGRRGHLVVQRPRAVCAVRLDLQKAEVQAVDIAHGVNVVGREIQADAVSQAPVGQRLGHRHADVVHRVFIRRERQRGRVPSGGERPETGRNHAHRSVDHLVHLRPQGEIRPPFPGPGRLETVRHAAAAGKAEPVVPVAPAQDVRTVRSRRLDNGVRRRARHGHDDRGADIGVVLVVIVVGRLQRIEFLGLQGGDADRVGLVRLVVEPKVRLADAHIVRAAVGGGKRRADVEVAVALRLVLGDDGAVGVVDAHENGIRRAGRVEDPPLPLGDVDLAQRLVDDVVIDVDAV